MTSAIEFTGTDGVTTRIFVVVERQVWIERRVHREGGGVVQDVVAVRIGLGDDGFADGAAGAAAVFDDELLAEHLAELVVDDARGSVGAAGRRIRHHHPHRAVRPGILRLGATHEWRRRHSGQYRAACEFAARHRSLPGLCFGFFWRSVLSQLNTAEPVGNPRLQWQCQKPGSSCSG
jgi:hypothetical protein